MGVGNPGSWGPAPQGDAPEAWFLDAMLSLRAPYAFPASLVTVLDAAWVIPAIGAYVAFVSIGADFGWGTLRTILLARRSRARYVAARLGVIATILVASLLLLLLVAPATQVVLTLVAGERFPTGPALPQTFGPYLATRVIAAFAWVTVAASLTLLARSLVGGLALVTTFLLVDSGLRALPGDGPLGLVRDLSLSGSIAAIVDTLRPLPIAMTVDYTVGALVPNEHQLPPPTHALSAGAAFVVLTAWFGIGALIAFWRARSIDILD